MVVGKINWGRKVKFYGEYSLDEGGNVVQVREDCK